MDGVTQLRCRNAELETELRLIKEQLAQAHAATSYLLTTLGRQRSAQEHSASARREERLGRAQEENAHLRALLAITNQCETAEGTHGHHRTHSLTACLNPQAPPSPPSTVIEQQELSIDADLLSFDDGDNAAFSESWSLPSHHRTAKADPQSLASITGSRDLDGLGISYHTTQSHKVATPLPQHEPPAIADGESIHKNDRADGSHSFVMATPASSFSKDQSSDSQTPDDTTFSPPSGPRWRVAHGLYCHLLGRACFAEDWGDEDWVQFARQRGVMGATEWQEYYAEVVRPRYLEIEAGKAAAVGVMERKRNDQDADTDESDTVKAVEEAVEVRMSSEISCEPTEPDDKPTRSSNAPAADMVSLKTRKGTPAEPIAHHLLTPEIKNTMFTQSSPDELRTVLITGLPPKTTLAEVLDKVRGGKIFASELLRTKGMRYANRAVKEEMNGALVTFLYSRDAKTYVKFVEAAQDVYFWHETWDAAFRAKVEIVETSSRAVLERLKHPDATRVVYLVDDSEGNSLIELTASAVVGMVLDWGMEDRNCWRGLQHTPPLRAGRDKDGILVFEFASMLAANHFKFALCRLGALAGMGVGCLPDGCAKDVDTLIEVAFAERPLRCAADSGSGQEADGEQEAVVTSLSKEQEYSFMAATPASEGVGRYSNDDLELARTLMSTFTKAGGRKEVRVRGRVQEG